MACSANTRQQTPIQTGHAVEQWINGMGQEARYMLRQQTPMSPHSSSNSIAQGKGESAARKGGGLSEFKLRLSGILLLVNWLGR